MEGWILLSTRDSSSMAATSSPVLSARRLIFVSLKNSRPLCDHVLVRIFDKAAIDRKIVARPKRESDRPAVAEKEMALSLNPTETELKNYLT